MDKAGMRDWVAGLEGMIDNKLKKWNKLNKIENGESIKIRWQFLQTDIVLKIFWEEEKELVILDYDGPRIDHHFKWHGLNNKTFNNVQDRIGNLAMSALHPPIDPEDDE